MNDFTTTQLHTPAHEALQHKLFTSEMSAHHVDEKSSAFTLAFRLPTKSFGEKPNANFGPLSLGSGCGFLPQNNNNTNHQVLGADYQLQQHLKADNCFNENVQGHDMISNSGTHPYPVTHPPAHHATYPAPFSCGANFSSNFSHDFNNPSQRVSFNNIFAKEPDTEAGASELSRETIHELEVQLERQLHEPDIRQGQQVQKPEMTTKLASLEKHNASLLQENANVTAKMAYMQREMEEMHARHEATLRDLSNQHVFDIASLGQEGCAMEEELRKEIQKLKRENEWLRAENVRYAGNAYIVQGSVQGGSEGDTEMGD
ncbi:hypothetical protein C1H76_6813 [Elsinoe australis]|uniref:Uncharacterized protein n=1 Tax=Elsinoe australis TaxID=40998 RepID=A0A4V6YAT0_9PEZI|nr:hypothetical protein C1H76_6813 [Elsinoe australis]